MAEEKGQEKFEETASDGATTSESDGVIDEKSLVRKLDRHLIPWTTVLLLLSFLDSGNGSSFSLNCPPVDHLPSVGNARIEGLVTDLHMSTFCPAAPQNIPLSFP